METLRHREGEWKITISPLKAHGDFLYRIEVWAKGQLYNRKGQHYASKELL